MSTATPAVVPRPAGPAPPVPRRAQRGGRGFGDASERVLAFWLLLPTALLLGLVVVYPVGRLIYTSFFDVRLSTPGAGRPVVATGDRRLDLAVRLRYAGVAHEVVDGPLAALDHAVGATGGGQRAEFLGNYTAFADLRRVL